ncbi:MED6-domain-containing protein [Phellopilus nigrolimitatus]|nr:MED6-domain-containing protein [Phellopilus nigrolimitatus]
MVVASATMDLDDLHPVDDYTHRFFIWHEWIQANGPLTTENVFDYFATSMFYDKQSNNQVLRMQTIHTGQPILNEAEELKRFTGVEFALVHAQPPSLFVIHKRERLSPEEVRPLAAYFVMNNRIYQSPDLYTVLSNRLLTGLHALQSSLDILRSHRPDFTPRTGFVWPIVDAPTAESLSKKRTAEDQLDAGNESSDSLLAAAAPLGSKPQQNEPKAVASGMTMKKQQNVIPLLHAMRTTAAHSSALFAAREASDAAAPPEPVKDTPLVSTTPAPTQPAREETPMELKSSKSFQLPPPESAASTSSRPSTAGGKRRKKRMSSAASIMTG